MKRHRAKLLLFLGLFFMFLIAGSGCRNQNQSFMKIEEIPVPEGANKSSFSGEYKDALLNRLSSIAQRMSAEGYKQNDEEIFFVAPETDWATINNFYQKRFLQSNLQVDEKNSGARDGYQIGVWRSGDTRQAVAITLIETGNAEQGNPRKFLAIILFEKSR